MTPPFSAWWSAPGFECPDSELETVSGPPSYRYPRVAPDRIQELLGHLRRGREEGLLPRPVRRIARSIDCVARRFLDPADALRIEAQEALRVFAGYSIPMAEAVLEGMARSWTFDSLWNLLQDQFPSPSVLDGFQSRRQGGWNRALGFPVTFHLGAGTVPGVSTTSLVRSLLVKSAVLLKPGLGDIPLPVLFARGLWEEDPELAGGVAVVYWPGEDRKRTEAVLKQVDLVVVYGGDETVRWVRSRVPPEVPLRAYRHRVGFALVGRGALAGKGTKGAEDAWTVARDAARAVALFDQRGCVSPQVIFVEEGGDISPSDWARLLARAFQELEECLPSGHVPAEEAVAIQHLRGQAEVGEGVGGEAVFHGGATAPWTVMVRPGGIAAPFCQNRTVQIIPVTEASEALEELKKWGGHLQTIALCGLGERVGIIQEALCRSGASRLVTLSQTPWPMPWWHHDGADPLRELVRWTDTEVPDPLS